MLLNQNLFYSKGTIVRDVYFTPGQESCRFCEYCYYREHFDTFVCRITGEHMLKPTVNNGERGRDCPILFEEESNE